MYHAIVSPPLEIKDSVYIPNQIEISGHSFPIDLDNDGLFDVELTSAWNTTTSVGGLYEYKYSDLRPRDNSVSVALNSIGSVRPNISSIHIDTMTNWGDPWNYISHHYGMFIDSIWTDIGPHYAALRMIKPNNDTLMGWIKFHVNDFYIITLHEWAFESENPIDTVYNHVTVGMEDEVLESDLRVYPNPFSEYLIIEDEGLNGKAFEVSIYTLEGKKVYQEWRTLRNRINTSDLLVGTYIIQVRMPGGEVINRKFIKLN